MDDKKDKKKGNKRNSKEFLNVVPFKTKSFVTGMGIRRTIKPLKYFPSDTTVLVV